MGWLPSASAGFYKNPGNYDVDEIIQSFQGLQDLQEFQGCLDEIQQLVQNAKDVPS